MKGKNTKILKLNKNTLMKLKAIKNVEKFQIKKKRRRHQEILTDMNINLVP